MTKTVGVWNKVAVKAKNVVENIPIQELSSTMDVQNTITTADTIAKIV